MNKLVGALESESQPLALLQPGLSHESFEYLGSNDRLRCVMHRLMDDCRLTIAVIGGSISAGSTYSVSSRGSSWLYHERLGAALRHACPTGANISVINGALPATGPGFFELCVGELFGDELLGSGRVLVILELAINVLGDLPAFERLIRRLIDRPVPPAILVLNSHSWPMANPAGVQHARLTGACFRVATAKQIARSASTGKPLTVGTVNTSWLQSEAQRAIQTWNQTGLDGDNDEDRIRGVCELYRLPLVSMRAALLKRVRTASPDQSLHHLSSFMGDCKHPNPQGHVFLAQMLLSRLIHAAQPSVCFPHHEPCAICPAVRQSQPSPMYFSSGVAQSAARCVRASGLSRLLLTPPSVGFQATDASDRKPGLVAQRPGSLAAFCLPRQKRSNAYGRLGSVWLGFLQSHSRQMGSANVTCEGSCGCSSVHIDGHTSAPRSVTEVVRIPLWATGQTRARCCEVRARVLHGNFFKLVSVIHSPASYGTSRGQGVPEPEDGTAPTDADRRVHREFKSPARRTRDVLIRWGVSQSMEVGI